MMKKILHILPMLAVLGFLVLQSSCWNNGYDPDYSFVISMNATQASSSTKGVINGIDELKNFGVYGYKVTPANAKHMIFANQQVSKDNSEWKYSPLKYWDRDAYYYFSAYAPYLPTKTDNSDVNVCVSTTIDNNLITNYTIENIPAWQDATDENSVDLIVADSHNSARYYLTDDNNTNHRAQFVEFTFSHVLALVDLMAYKVDGCDFTITQIQVGANDDKVLTGNDNCLSQNLTPDSENNLPSYSLIKSETKGVATWYSADGTTDKGKEIISTDSDAPTAICQMLAFPEKFASSGLSMTISYKTDGAPQRIEFKLSNLTALESGKHYSILVKFVGGNVVDVNVSEVQNWNKVNKNHYVYNW